MRSPRYTILIANRKTGAVRRLTVARLAVGGGGRDDPGRAPPVSAGGLGARRASRLELESLRIGQRDPEARERQLPRGDRRTDRPDFLAADGARRSSASRRSSTRRRARRSQKLPARDSVARDGRRRAADDARADSADATATPEGTFGMLKDLLGVARRHASRRSKTKVESQQALARATPSIWPIAGWLSSGFGNRKDPFTGQPDFHPGLDISADSGTPVRATADGDVESAGYNGNYGNCRPDRPRLRHRHPLRPPLRLRRAASARRSSAARSSATSARRAAPPARTCTTRSCSTASRSIRCDCWPGRR